MDSVASKCQFLKTKLIVSESSPAEWLNFSDLLEAASAVHSCVKTKSQDPMVIYFISGTTGSPKMVNIPMEALVWIFCSMEDFLILATFVFNRYWMNLTPSDIMWKMSDTVWVKAAISSISGPWFQGTCVFGHATPQFDLRAILNIPSDHSVQCPSCLVQLVQHDLGRYCTSAQNQPCPVCSKYCLAL